MTDIDWKFLIQYSLLTVFKSRIKTSLFLAFIILTNYSTFLNSSLKLRITIYENKSIKSMIYFMQQWDKKQ